MALRINTLFILCGLILFANPHVVQETTTENIQRAFSHNQLTSRQLVEFYLRQIQVLNPTLHGVVEVTPDAGDEAAKADSRIRRKTTVGELDGIPVLLKDNILIKEKLNTTAGSDALCGAGVSGDATVAERLRNAGTMILRKASMSEWCNFRSLNIPDDRCARGGKGVNPYVLSKSPYGSSSGSAISVAANMMAVSLGTETHGSTIFPPDYNSVVRFKPTVGLTSRAGVIPISPRQDSVGPICRTVSDAVYVLDAIVGFDPRDSQATEEASMFIPDGGYKQFLNGDGLAGKRLGVVRSPFCESYSEYTAIPAFEAQLNILRERGAILVDNLEIENVDMIRSPSQSGESTALLAEFKLNINEYLRELTSTPARSLAVIIAFNENNPDLETTDEYGQLIFMASEVTNGIGEEERTALEKLANLSCDGFEKLMTENELDATVTLGLEMSSVLTIGGYPEITVPAEYGQLIFMASEVTNGIGEEERTALEKLANLSCDGFEKLMTENELDATVILGLEMSSVLAIGGCPEITVPTGYGENGMPFGICFGGLKGTETKLIEVAYGFEQATMIRRPPALLQMII